MIGGGQLGRMLGIAARQMGYGFAVFDPEKDGPAAQVADWQVNAPYSDLEAAQKFAAGVDVITFEFENVQAETLAAVEKLKPVHPSPKVLATTRHRLREKDFLNSIGVKTAPYRAVRDLDSLRAALRELGTPSILKTVEFGYDGKGQFKFAAAGENIDDQAEEAWNAIGRQAAILEGFVTFDKEVSVVAARGQNGAYHPFAVFENEHREQILDLTTWPADVSAIAARRAFDMAAAIGRELNIVGVYCVEYFVHGNTVIANEIAPRPHNSGHLTIDAADVSQFEQQLRAVCGLPLHTPVRTCGAAAMAQLLGDLWQDGEPAWDKAITGPNVHLHLYGKKDAKAKRKMGHLTATADTVAEARRNVENARKALSGPSPSGRG